MRHCFMLFIQAGLDKKRSILQKIEQHGAKNCNWVHQPSNKNTTVDSHQRPDQARFCCPVLLVLLGRKNADLF